MVMTMGTIYLLRHGQTKWNKEEVFRGQYDISLNEVGREQARALGEALRLEGLKNPVFLSSPLSRARETAEIAANSIGLGKDHVEIDSSFLDISYGKWEGKTRKEVEKQYPKVYQTWVSDPEKVVFPGGESLGEAADRAEDGIYRAAQENLEGDTVIVAHRAVNIILLCRLLRAVGSAFWKIRQETGCINVLNYTNSTFVLVKVNEICHLRTMERDETDF